MEALQNFYQKYHNIQYVYPKIPDGVDKFSWIVGPGRIPYLKINLAGPWQEILKEAEMLDHLFVPHRDDGESQGWSSLCLHGLGATKTDSPSAYPEYRGIPDDQLPYAWTEISDLCPVATKYFKTQFPYSKYFRLRFMKIDAGGYIAPHHDSQTFRLGAVNISLNNPAGCEMILKDAGPVPFDSAGSVMAFNTSYDHMVWNNSTEARYHMIVHGQYLPQWRSIVVNSYDTV